MHGGAVWRRTALPGGLLLAGLLLFAASGTRPAGATELLSNGGFESWPDTWVATGNVAQVASPSVAGNALQLTGPGSIRYPAIEAVPGSTYTFSVAAEAGGASGTAGLHISFLDGDLDPTGSPGGGLRPLTAAFSVISATAVAPQLAAYVLVSADVTTAGSVAYVDNASLVATAPPPTATPTSPAVDTPTETPTATATEASPSATPTDPGADEPSTTPGQPKPTKPPTATKTATATKTPTVPKAATATKTPTAPKAPTAAKTPTRTPPSPTAGGFGGMLLNGDFETDDGGKPAFWTKFGGTMSLSSSAHGGSHAASLESETSSTKWLYQVVSVDGGQWYDADGFARVDGGGEAFIRVSWYASDDGSGSSTDQADSDTTSDASWTAISTGAIQAPDGTASARVRLMLRPDGDTAVTASFDDVEMYETDTPPPAPTQAAGEPTDVVAGVVVTPRPAPSVRSSGSAGFVTTTGTAAAGAGTLRLSEILSDPAESGRDSAYEWVELVNTGSSPANTAGWTIGDASSSDVLGTAVVSPGGYVLVAASGAVLPSGVSVVRIADGEIGGGINNTGDVLKLTAPDASEADVISFGDNKSVFDPPPSAPGAGATLGVRDPKSDPDAANWALTDRPTPGEPNSFAAPREKPAAQPSAILSAPAPATGATVIVERRGDGSSTLLWAVIGVLALAVALLGGFVFRGPLKNLLLKGPL